MPKRKNSLSLTRINVLSSLTVLISFVLILRLAQIQLLQHSKYSAIAEDQHWIVQEIPSARGRILSSDGALLVSNQIFYLLYAEPRRIEDKSFFAREVAALLSTHDYGTEEELFIKYYDLLDNDLWWVPLEQKINPALREELDDLNLPGMGFEINPQRYYPEGTLAGQVLGFVAFNEAGERLGYFGIEGSMDGELKGRSGKIMQEKDARGRPILLGDYQRVDPIEGRELVLTIDRGVQYIVEQELKEGVERYGADTGSVIVMDPSNGDIIAMANYPPFDPAEVVNENDAKNLAIADTYEPGSIMKPFTVAAALDQETISPQSTFYDGGPAEYSGHVIDNWDGSHHGIQTISELLEKSNNIGAAWVGHQLGAEKLHDYLFRFGFGQKYGFPLEGEDTGKLRDPSTWYDIDLANISFGQGMSATPLQVLNAFNVFANGGILYRPRIIQSVRSENKTITKTAPHEVRRVLSEETVEAMHSLLISSVDLGVARSSNIDGYKIAGKTGTGQVPVDGRYDLTRTNGSFLGYLAESKKYSMIVRLEHPKTSPFGAATAAPTWMEITRRLVNYYGIPPDF